MTTAYARGRREFLSIWRGAFERAHLRTNVLAGLTSTGVTLALALLSARHADMPFLSALFSLVIGSFVVALLGGTTLGVAGPGLALGFAMVAMIKQFGLPAVALAGLICGLVQLAIGSLRIARFAKLIPLGVVHGFVWGLGLLLIVQSMPHLLGLSTPEEIHTFALFDYTGARLGEIRFAGLAMGAVVCVVVLLGNKRFPKAPVALLAVALGTAANGLGNLHLEALPDAPLEFLWGKFPGIPLHGGVTQFIVATLEITVLASLETLLSASAEDDRHPELRHNPDREFLGYGITNILVSLAGGMLSTGSYIRTEANIQAGARTRAAAIFHALFVAMFSVVILLVDRWVPIAALAGVVIAYSIPLLRVDHLRMLWKNSRSQSAVAIVVAGVFVFDDLLHGVEVGLVIALIITVAKVARTRVVVHRGKDGAPHQVTLSGPVTFLAGPVIDKLRSELNALDVTRGVIMDLRAIHMLDHTGADRLRTALIETLARSRKIALLGVSPQVRDLLLGNETERLTPQLAVTDKDVDRILDRAGAFEMRAQVIANLERFRSDVRDHMQPLLDQLASSQTPHTLFVTCVDSRIMPDLLTGAHPGELFIVRCMGALIPPPSEVGGLPTVGAAVEYAVGVLGVRNIVVCGHSQCGAVKAVKSGHVPPEFHTLNRWLDHAATVAGDLHHHHDLDDAGRSVTVQQIENLMEFNIVRERVERGELSIYAWFYNVGQAEVYEWDPLRKSFAVMGASRTSFRPLSMVPA